MKKAIVIGATSGIGKELARLLAGNGYQVGITGRRTALLQELQSENPGFYIKTFDITQTDSVTEKLEELVSELGGLDLLVISSGTGDRNDSLSFPVEKPAIDTNVLGFTCICDWAFNYFKQKQSGHLVAISSIAGIRGNRYAPAYSASKAYQINYLEALRQKAKHIKLPVCITDIRPGFVDTAMAQGDGIFWVAPPKKAAKQILKAIRKKKKVAHITKRWKLIAVIMKILPKAIYDKI